MLYTSLVVTIHGLCAVQQGAQPVNSNICFILYPAPIIAKKGGDVYKKSVQIYVIMLHENREVDIMKEGKNSIRKRKKS